MERKIMTSLYLHIPIDQVCYERERSPGISNASEPEPQNLQYNYFTYLCVGEKMLCIAYVSKSQSRSTIGVRNATRNGYRTSILR